MSSKTNGSITPIRKKTVTPIRPSAAGAQEAALLEEEIRRRAYEIYQARNGSPGDQRQDWLMAEREVLARHQHERRA